jgi:hypothetical protein
MKPNNPVPVIRPKVVATALLKATSAKIVPWVRSSHRRNLVIPALGPVVLKRRAFTSFTLSRI